MSRTTATLYIGIAILILAVSILATGFTINKPLSKITTADILNKIDSLESHLSQLESARSYTPALANNVMTRALNSPFMVSAQRQAIVVYNVVIGNSATLVLGNQGQTLLETKTGAGAWTTISTSQSGVGSGLVFAGNNSLTVFGVVGRGDSVRLRTVNQTGTPTYTALQGMEIQIN